MDRKDRQFITWNKRTTRYMPVFRAPSGPIEARTKQLIELYDDVVRCFRPVFSPTEVTIKGRLRETEESADDQSSSGSEGLELTATNADGVTGADLRSVIEPIVDREGTWPDIRELETTDTICHVFLEQGERDITTESPEYRIRDGAGAIDKRPDKPVWMLRFQRTSGEFAPEGVNVETTYEAYLATATELYFDIYENEISRINAAKLAQAFKSIRTLPELLTIDTLHTDANRQVSPTIADEILTGIIGLPEKNLSPWPDVDAMIQEYRVDWFLEHGTVASSDSDGPVRITCPRPDAMNREELRARVDAAFARRDPELNNGDRLIVECEDIEASGTVRDGRVDWDETASAEE